MIHESKYRRQAIQSWEATREETKAELRAEMEILLSKLQTIRKYFNQLVTYLLQRRGHQ